MACFKSIFKYLVFYLPISVNAQLVVDNTAPYNDPAFLVQSVLLSTGVIATNITFNGSGVLPTGANADMIGYFNGGSSNLNVPEGVILNTGNIYDAPGPNDSGSDGVDNLTGGDPDLDQLSGVTSYNASILEFDFETVTDGISFRYVFASEEYNEYVCSGYNDVFGFFISGPGIAGPFSNGAENIALVPSSGVYVGINTVNNGSVGTFGSIGGCGGPGDPGLNNTTYFVDNEALGGQSIQYDGFTTVLTAQKTLLPCEVYHIKMAVADAGDGIFDSGVFLEAASFGAIGIQVQVGQVGAPIASVVEGCDSMLFHFSRPGNTNLPFTIYFNITGTAINGVDYDLFPDSIVIPAGSSFFDFYLSAYIDGIPEGIEDIIITIPANLTNNTCIDDVPSTATVTIINTDPLVLTASNDTTICPGENVQLSSNVTGGIGPYSYSWSPTSSLSCSTCPNPIATPSNPTTYTITVTDDCGTAILTEDIIVNVGGIIVEPTNNLFSVEGCQNASFTFTRVGPTTNDETIYFTISGTATNGVDYIFIVDSVIIPAGQSSIDINVLPIMDGLSETNESIIITTIPDTTSFCSSPNPSTTTIYIMNVDSLAIIASNDTLMCGGVSTTITSNASGGVLPYSYIWHNGIDTLGNTQNLFISPSITTTYTVSVSDTCGNPIATDDVTIIITNPPPTIQSMVDTAYEGCRDALFSIIRTDSSTGQIIIHYTISGTAINGTDYSSIIDSIIIPAGETSADLVISAIMDGNSEGGEMIIITLPRDSTDTICYVIPFSDTIYIKNVDPISVSVLDQYICPGDTTILEGSASGGLGPLQFSWSNGESGTSTVVSPLDSTVYSLTVSDTCGNVQIKNDIIVDVGKIHGSIISSGVQAHEGCKNTSFTFYLPMELNYDYTITYSIGGSATMIWDYEPINNTVIIPAGMLSTTIDIESIYDSTAEGLENVVLTIIPNNNDTLCPHVFTSSIEILDVDPISVNALGDTIMCNFDVVIASIASGGYGPLNYSWNNFAGNDSNVLVNPSRTTIYTITVFDSCQTSVASDSLTIEVDCEYLFHIPNTFTPNGDGINEVFNAKWKGMKTYKMHIFNRWGDLLFTTENPEIGWDGRANEGDHLSEQEVYVYLFETTDFLDISHEYVGKITIIR